MALRYWSKNVGLREFSSIYQQLCAFNSTQRNPPGKPSTRVRLSFIALLVVLVANCSASSAVLTRSADAVVHFDPNAQTWNLTTAKVEEELRLTRGMFELTALRNRQTGTNFVSGSQPPDEFRVTVDGKPYTGRNGDWRLRSTNATLGRQGEIQLVVDLQNAVLRVEKTYVVYPHTGIIRQWVSFRNITENPIILSDPYLLEDRFKLDEGKRLRLNYMTGGGYFTGSQILKRVPLTSAYARTFDSTDKPERTELGGSAYGTSMPWGSGAYMQWFCLDSDTPQQGVYVGFDYYGRWAADIGNYFGSPGYVGIRVAGFHKTLVPQELVLTPKSFIGVFAGDLDSMGNGLKDWQYEYLWDYTNNSYFAKIRYGTEMQWQTAKGDVDWGGGTQDNWDFRLATAFHTIDLMRYVGAQVMWQDAGWHDYLGDNDGPDYQEAKEYMEKYGFGLAVWWPLYTVSEHSKVYRQHPEWLSDSETFSGSNLNTSRNDVIDYLLNQLGRKVSDWGDFQWRLDGTAVVPVNNDETPMLAEYHNVMGLLASFRREHPNSSIDICSGGGNLMGFETLRLSDVSQLTDGGALYISNYYSSYLFPPDKIDDWTRVANFTWENARSVLTMAPAWTSDRGLYGGEPGLSLNYGLENLRRTFEIYRYMLAQGVAGRWSHVFHPRVDGDDPVYYFERLSRDGQRGVIILKHFAKGSIEIFPKGLVAETVYDVRFEMSKSMTRRSGHDLMENGIRIVNPLPGELIYLGLPNHPGSGLDHTPPSDPTDVTKRIAVHMDVTGVDVQWKPADDNNWLSYYQIYRDGKPIDKVATATFYFDHSGGPENILASYQVQAVDGDGNNSRKVTAMQVAGRPDTYTARTGFLAGKGYSHQGANGWSYEEWAGTTPTEMKWNPALGHMGLYEGTGPERHPAIIGASWMSPGESTDAVRVFTIPYTGIVRVTGTVHKDIYHTYGDGVRARLLKNKQQLWPSTGWETIAASDVSGKSIALTVPVQKGDKLFFQLNRNGNAVDDNTVWDPHIEYDRIRPFESRRVSTIDSGSSRLTYTGTGWQRLGLNPWNSDVDDGYLPAWIQGTISVSATPGDAMSLKFHGTGIELIGDVGGNGGIATIALDGKQVATIDTFSPSHVPSSIWSLPRKQIGEWGEIPHIRLWGMRDLKSGEHTFEVLVTGKQNRDSIGAAIGIDAVRVMNGSVDQPKEP